MKTDRNVDKWSPLLTRCQAEADTAMVDVAVVVAEDAVVAEAKTTEVMAPQTAKASAVHSEPTSLIMAPGMQKTNHNVSKWSPLLTRCQAEADTAMVDMVVAVAEDAVMAEAKATEAMAPRLTKVCAAHL